MADEQAPAPNTPAPQQWTERLQPGRFTDQTVVVTGAGSGIGRAVALRVAREGGRVVACDIDRARLDALVAEAGDTVIVPVVGDVSNEVDVASIALAAGSRVDGLANVAGIMDDFTPVHEVSDAVWERVFQINVTGVMRLTRALVPRMLEAGSGAIVNVTSEAGLRGSAAGVAYTASKHAVVGVTRNSAVMYGPEGIRTNAVAPGATLTNIEAHFGSELSQRRLGPFMQVNIGAPAQATQVAATIAFLLSDDSTNVNGAILPSDGGWNAI